MITEEMIVVLLIRGDYKNITHFATRYIFIYLVPVSIHLSENLMLLQYY